MVDVADVITCASEFIRKRSMDFHPRSLYLPDSVDFRHFRFEKLLSDFDKPFLSAIWSGMSHKASELAELFPLLISRGISLTVISEKKPSLPGPYTYLPWSYLTFPRDILKGEICVTPRRTDNSYDLGHSHFKIGVFLTQRVPALASCLPSYIEAIGKTGGGIICNYKFDWEVALDQVLKNRQILKDCSINAKRGMLSYSTELITQKYIQLFQSLSGTGF